MSSRIHLGVDETIPVPFSFEERDVILAETMIEPDLEKRFRTAAIDGDRILVALTLSDIEDFMGHIAVVANHTEDRKLERTLDATWERLRGYEDRYEDELFGAADPSGGEGPPPVRTVIPVVLAGSAHSTGGR